MEIILPVYNAAAELSQCLDALLTRLPQWASLQIVDDASTDSAVTALLASHALCRRPAVRVHRNPVNLGFIGNVNAALARTRSDVVLLNSDTVVTTGWLERLRDCAESDLRIASITPFSNNAEICSFPLFCRVNPVPEDPEMVATAFAVTVPEYPSLPTGVGFCMFMRRAAIDEVGDLDAATFGRAYGEENDWCMRASAHGWRHVLCDNAYVVHQGAASLGPANLHPGGEQLAKLLARYPGYNALIADFIARDPVAGRRQAVIDRLGTTLAKARPDP